MSDTPNVGTEILVVNRIIEAPVKLVWAAWTESELVKRWWGPKNYTSPECRIDLRVGGKYLFTMRAPAEWGGEDSYTAGEYLRIVPLERLEFTESISDKNGVPLQPGAPGMPPDFPQNLHTVVTFENVSGLTRLVITTSGWTSGTMFVFALAGLHQSIDKLEFSLLKTAG
jgi:uncharacterized protein YndB with AHSA1/START domain